MRYLARWLPHFLVAGLLAAVLVAALMKDGRSATFRTASAYVLEPAGPKPRLFVAPADVVNGKTSIEMLMARQQLALQKYRAVFRSYLRWRKEKLAQRGEATFVLQPVRVRCSATNVLMPRNWCWYAHAAKWTERELSETKARLAAWAALQARTLPYTGDWRTAVRIAQRVYPGTELWLLSCSSGEGGHGGFVMNHQGSGASGWLQFMPSTFYGHVDVALSNTKQQGFRVPESARSISSPLGQALTGAYMRTHGMSSHWDPGIDPLCR